MKARLALSTIVVGGVALVAGTIALAGKPTASTALYPDMRTVVPTHLNLVNQQQEEILRFSNGIANTGAGPWALRPDPPPSEATTTVSAVQEFRDSGAYYKCGEQPKQVGDCYNVVSEKVAGTFEFHPAHNHWHIGDVALFEIRKGSPTPSAERTFFDCYTSFQGISSGWVDQYHQSTEGQQLRLTGLPNGNDYYLVSTSNYAQIFTETDYTNNTAWVRFTLSSDSKGNRKVTVTDHSPCDSPGLCGERSTNR
jgi:hypothetical protein